MRLKVQRAINDEDAVIVDLTAAFDVNTLSIFNVEMCPSVPTEEHVSSHEQDDVVRRGNGHLAADTLLRTAHGQISLNDEGLSIAISTTQQRNCGAAANQKLANLGSLSAKVTFQPYFILGAQAEQRGAVTRGAATEHTQSVVGAKAGVIFKGQVPIKCQVLGANLLCDIADRQLDLIRSKCRVGPQSEQ